MALDILPIQALRDNYIWTLINRSNNYAICVDPGESQPLLDCLEREKAKLAAILITHHHWDHTNGIKDIIKHHDVPVYGPKKEHIPHLTYPLSENDIVQIKELEISFKIIEIPGHTKGHIAYYGQKMLFCGDTLFTAGCGRIFEGTTEQMFESLHKLASLPKDTLIYCGHEYTENNLHFALALEPNNENLQQRLKQTENLRQKKQATVPAQLEIERLTNPFLRSHEKSICQAAEKFSGKELRTPIEVFAEIRNWKNHF